MEPMKCKECKNNDVEMKNKVGRPRLRCDECHAKYWKNYIRVYQKNYKKKGASNENNKTTE